MSTSLPVASEPSETLEPADPEKRSWFRRWIDEPNPVWLREMRQSARLTRTPLILAALTIVIALIICTVGGVSAGSADPAAVGTVIYHTFFSIAFAIVSWVGPGVAAMTIASERSGRTWEAVLLTRLTTRQIARGKFAASFTYISMYVVMLAPVGALPFLFGGVTALEVTLAFAYLLIFSALAVGFGLSISSAVSSPAVAMLVTIPAAVVLSQTVYLTLGVAASAWAHSLWPSITQGAPVWLPTAYSRAEFGWLYLLVLVFAPLAGAAVLGWLFHEITAANIAQPGDDRSSGLRRWYLAATPVLLLAFLIPRFVNQDRDDHWMMYVGAMAAIQCLAGFGLLLFAGEPLTRSRRVEARFQQSGASALRRFLGPGIEPALLLVLVLGGGILALLTGLGVWQEYLNSHVTSKVDLSRVGCVLSFGGYGLCFLLFLTGLVLWTRAHSKSGAAPRVILIVAVLVANAGPWLVLAMGGLIGRVDELLWLASPSPAFVFALFDVLLRKSTQTQDLLLAMILSSTTWALIGLLLWGIGSRARRQRVAAERAEQKALAG